MTSITINRSLYGGTKHYYHPTNWIALWSNTVTNKCNYLVMPFRVTNPIQGTGSDGSTYTYFMMRKDDDNYMFILIRMRDDYSVPRVYNKTRVGGVDSYADYYSLVLDKWYYLVFHMQVDDNSTYARVSVYDDKTLASYYRNSAQSRSNDPPYGLGDWDFLITTSCTTLSEGAMTTELGLPMVWSGLDGDPPATPFPDLFAGGLPDNNDLAFKTFLAPAKLSFTGIEAFTVYP